jgi:uncharacterized protein (TIGR04255 family)
MTLPQPDPTLLASPPLIATLCQVRFDQHPEVTDARTGSALSAQLASTGLTVINQIQHQQILINTGGPSEQPPPVASQQAGGWQLATKTGDWQLGVLADQMTLETRAYGSWERFSRLWDTALLALAEVVGPELVTRTGLRYVNRISPSGVTTFADFRGSDLIDLSFLGPAVNSPLSDMVTGTEGRAVLSFPDGTDAMVQHGISVDQSPVFVLDIDCFRQQAVPFDAQQLLAMFRNLNEKALSTPPRTAISWSVPRHCPASGMRTFRSTSSAHTPRRRSSPLPATWTTSLTFTCSWSSQLGLPNASSSLA